MTDDWQTKHIDPTVDCVFKRLLGSEENKVLTLDFLNAFLGHEGEECLKDLDFMDPHLVKHHLDDKRPVVDVMVSADDGGMVQIEVQAYFFNGLVNRAVYDWSKMLSCSLVEGENYRAMKGAISIWILTENLFPREVTEEVILKFRISCPEAGLEMKADSYILVVQLKNWKGHGTLNPAAERWIMLFREGENIDLHNPPECLNDEVMRMALDVMKNFAKDRLEFLRYEREMTRRRMNEWEDDYLNRQIVAERQAKEAALEAKEQERQAKEQERQAKERERQAKEAALEAKEQERHAKEQERQAKEQERQAKERERQAKEAALEAKEQERQAKEAALELLEQERMVKQVLLEQLEQLRKHQ
jgi:predicted transposase/invertase (TIGR01784 family)